VSIIKTIDDYDTFPYPKEKETKEQRKERKRWESLTPEQKEQERKAHREEFRQLEIRAAKVLGEGGRPKYVWDDILDF
jgi:hypothetical protein